MALAIDASSPAMASSATSLTITTAAFTTPTDVFLLALVGRNGINATDDDTGTVSGAGLTWTLAGRKSQVGAGQIAGGTGQPGCAEVWWAYSASALTAQTVSDARGANGAQHHALQVMVLTGAETTWGGAIGATGANGALPSLATATTAANAWMFSVVSDWAATGTSTVGSGQTRINDYSVSTQITVRFWRQTAATTTSGTSVTENLTAPSAEQYNMLNVEVRPVAGAVTPIPAPPRVVSRAARIRSSHF